MKELKTSTQNIKKLQIQSNYKNLQIQKKIHQQLNRKIVFRNTVTYMLLHENQFCIS